MLNIYLEERFIFFNGEYYSLVYDDEFWDRYLEIFNRVFVVARINNINDIHKLPKGYKKVTKSEVEFLHLPHYQGLVQGVLNIPFLFFSVFKIVRLSEKNILRLPGIISIFAGIFSLILNKKFAVELVGDPYDVFSSGVGGKLSKLLRLIFTYMTKMLIKNAVAVSYVTERTMQKRYPANRRAFLTYYSSISLDDNVFHNRNIRTKVNKENFKILLVGSLEQMYKGFDIAILAISNLSFKDKTLTHIVGDGIYKEYLERLIKERNMEDYFIFHGKVSREEIFKLMEDVDVFLMPSRTEGLPRALIEAMSKGLPAIGSNVGGIPELLPNEWIFKSEDHIDLSEKITQIYYNDNIEDISKVNMLKAKEFRSDILQKRRNKLYSVLKNSV